MYLAFLDLKSAFDRVPKNEIWISLNKLDVNKKLINVIKSIYKNVQGSVRLNGQQSGNFRMKKGIKQGDSLSPLLFIVFMDQIIKHCRRRTRRYKIGNWKLRPIYLQSLIYADDIVLINSNVAGLQNAVIEWASTLEERGMEVNIGKSKLMKIGGKKKILK